MDNREHHQGATVEGNEADGLGSQVTDRMKMWVLDEVPALGRYADSIKYKVIGGRRRLTFATIDAILYLLVKDGKIVRYGPESRPSYCLAPPLPTNFRLLSIDHTESL